MILILSYIGIICGLIILCRWFYQHMYRTKDRLQESIESAQRQLDIIKKECEAERRDALSRLKEEIHRKRTEVSTHIRKEQLELERAQITYSAKAEKLQEREKKLEEAQRALQQTERSLTRLSDQVRINEHKVKVLSEDLTAKLENVSCMTKDEARKTLLKMLEEEILIGNKKWIQKVEDEARSQAKERAANILVNVMQRTVAEQVSSHTSGIVTLPSEEMKGRIIGKEGRNIKALEMATGMEFIVEGGSESITITGFNPIRREIARRSLEKLMVDGRINPTRIEETVLQCEQEMEETILQYGHSTLKDLNIQGVHEEIIPLLGKLHFRTSFSQNVLTHSIEVGRFARMIAEDLGLPRPDLALRGGLLHDIGKALPAEIEGTHALLGAEIAKRCGENPLVVNAIAAHHEEVSFTSIYGPIVMIADALSASRPGARRETLSTYIKRLERLEDIAHAFEGVKRAYALQAGREIRVIVEEAMVNDEQAFTLAHTIARRIETEMAFPGQIKVNVIRETRSIEYAR
jgi:ribonuclease Y